MDALLKNVMNEAQGCVQVYEEVSGQAIDFDDLSVEEDTDPTTFKP
jgi:hypothetical protein